MKYSFFLLFMLLGLHSVSAQELLIDEDGRSYFEMSQGDTTYTMMQYFFCHLNAVEGRDSMSQERVNTIQTMHLSHIDSLAQEGLLSIAGPYGDKGIARGILILNVGTQEEAERLAAADPAVKNGRLSIDIRPIWLAKGSVLK